MLFRQLFDADTCTYTYLIADTSTGAAAIFDPVLEQAERDLNLIQELKLNLLYSFETHVHADHITGASKLKQATGCQIIYPVTAQITCADGQIADNELIQLDSISIQALHTPGHTDCSTCYYINQDRVLTGDSLFIRGCGRTDFQSGDAATLYKSIQAKLFSLPTETLVFPAHDYKGMTCSTIGEEKQLNPRLANKTEADFIAIMDQLNLPKPKRIDIAVPANKQCGNL